MATIAEVLEFARSRHAAGHLAEAEAIYRQVLDVEPGNAVALHLLGAVAQATGRPDLAVDLLGKALAIQPTADACNDLGNALKDLARLDEAVAAYDRALTQRPAFPEAHYNRAIALHKGGRLDDAIAGYDRAIALNPDFPLAHLNRGKVLYESARFDEAVAACRHLVARWSHVPMAFTNLGNALHALGRLDEAIASHRQAVATRPDEAEAHLNLGLALLAAGRIREGLDECEWRWQAPSRRATARRFDRPQWDGTTDLRGKTILVWGEQGVGDEILWSAFVPEIIERAGRCLVECTPKLVPLLARSFPDAEVRATDRADDASRTDFDCHVPMGSLYRVLGAEAPRTQAFLRPDPARVAFWRHRLEALGRGPCIGIAWTSSLVTPERANAYTRLEDWGPVFALNGAVFVNLQHGNRVSGEATRLFGATLHDFAELDLFNDLDDVAALVAALDAVVSVATAVAGIASGVGTPTWRLTWRQDVNNSLLYDLPGPSVTYFHRGTGASWNPAFKKIANRLMRMGIHGHRR